MTLALETSPLDANVFEAIHKPEPRTPGVQRILSFLTILAIVISVLLAPGFALANPSHSAPGTAPGDTIRAGSESGYPPFCIVGEDGRADGFSVELLQAALRTMHRNVTFTIGPWARVKQDLAEGRVQVLPLVGRTPGREQIYDFTFPYLTMHGTIVVRDTETGILAPEDLRGRRVAVMAGDNAEEFLRRVDTGAAIVTTPTFKPALQGLSEGRYDAVVIQKLLALQLINELGIANLKTVGPPLQDFVQSFCFAVRKGDHKLLSILNEGLSLVIADGTFDRLHAKWFGPLNKLEYGHSPIIVGGDDNYPPYEFIDAKGQPAGYNVDLTRAIARQMGITVDIRLGPWGEIRKGLENGQIDIIQGMFYSPERDAIHNFSPAHSVVNHVMAVRKGTTIPRDMTDLHGKSIVVMNGDIMHDLAAKNGYTGQLIPAESQEEALRLLAEGQGDVALVAKIPALYWIQKHRWKNLKVADRSLLSPEYCYAAPHGNDRVLKLFSEGLANLRDTGEYRDIYSKWLGVYEPAHPGWRTIIKYSLFTTGPICALLILAVLWSRTLSRKVALKTAELRKEIAERQQRELEIRAKNTELDEKNAELERFTYTASHDLKSPLVTLKSFLGFMERDLEKGDAERVRTDMQYMHNAVDRMNILLANLLEMSRIGKGTSYPETVSFRTVVDEALLLLRGAIVEAEAEIRITGASAVFHADRVRLVEIWQNLIDNALKYRQPDIPVHIDIGLDYGDGAPVFFVRDNGIGIEPRYHQKIFGLFDQLNPGMQGSGVGLALVKRIVELYGGNIWVESGEQRQGTCFRFTLPGALAKGEKA